MTPYYQDDAVTIYHGAARDVLPDLNVTVDLLLTDPPYGLSYADEAGNNVAADGARQGVRVFRQVLFEAVPILAEDAHLLAFCHWQGWPDFYDAASGYVKMRNALIWHKNNGGRGAILTDYLRNYEVILYGTRGARPLAPGESYSAVLSGYKVPAGDDREHPTQKPVDLLANLTRRHCPADGLVLDPFMGTGATLLAAKYESRRAIGIEIEERYCEIAPRRCSQEVLGLAL